MCIWVGSSNVEQDSVKVLVGGSSPSLPSYLLVDTVGKYRQSVKLILRVRRFDSCLIDIFVK